MRKTAFTPCFSQKNAKRQLLKDDARHVKISKMKETKDGKDKDKKARQIRIKNKDKKDGNDKKVIR
jgi:hypothetical protein